MNWWCNVKTKYLVAEMVGGKFVKYLAEAGMSRAVVEMTDKGQDELLLWLSDQGLSCHAVKGRHSESPSEIWFIHPTEDESFCTGFFQQVVENSHDEIYVCDGEGRTIYCNKGFERNYGISMADIIGKTAMSMVESGFTDKTPIVEVLRTKKQVTMEQLTVTGRRLIITATPLLNGDGSIRFIVENCRDVTELERMKDQLDKIIAEARRYKAEAESLRRLEQSADGRLMDGGVMKRVLDTADRVARTDATVLVLGESGTGKSHIAKYIHEKSARQSQPFISVNCSTIAPTLFESELFGYVPGAFTGAGNKGKAGLVELADKGTLFLDEIGELPVALQAKLLELIQEKRYLPVGAIRYKHADVRIIAATNQKLQTLVEEKRFREDLYYRLKVIDLIMPPLRERKADIAYFIDVFMDKFNAEYGYVRTLSVEAKRILEAHDWPGNIRELQNLIHNLVIMAPDDVILPADLPFSLLMEASNDGSGNEGGFDQLMENYEKAIIQRYFNAAGSSYKLAEMLNISQSKAYRLIRKHLGEGIDSTER